MSKFNSHREVLNNNWMNSTQHKGSTNHSLLLESFYYFNNNTIIPSFISLWWRILTLSWRVTYQRVVDINNMPKKCSTKETFLQDFLEFLKRFRIFRKSWGTVVTRQDVCIMGVLISCKTSDLCIKIHDVCIMGVLIPCKTSDLCIKMKTF